MTRSRQSGCPAIDWCWPCCPSPNRPPPATKHLHHCGIATRSTARRCGAVRPPPPSQQPPPPPPPRAWSSSYIFSANSCVRARTERVGSSSNQNQSSSSTRRTEEQITRPCNATAQNTKQHNTRRTNHVNYNNNTTMLSCSGELLPASPAPSASTPSSAIILCSRAWLASASTTGNGHMLVCRCTCSRWSARVQNT